jgi:hypothetical protein
MGDDKQKGAAHGQWTERLRLLLQIIGVLSPIIALAAFFGLQPEKRKVLEWEYVAKSALVNATATDASVSVLYNNRPIKQLTSVSARLTNAGGAPIQEADVEASGNIRKFPSVDFGTAATILSCNVTGANRPNITATCLTSGSSIRVEHGLLNPGDTVTLEVRFEGDPGELSNLPPVAYRIAGISRETTRYSSSSDVRIPVTLVSVPPAMQWAILAAASALAIIALILGGVGYASAFRSAFPTSARRSELTAKIRQSLANMSEIYLPPDLPVRVARHVYYKLPSGPDTVARTAIEQLTLRPGESAEDFIRRAEGAALNAIGVAGHQGDVVNETHQSILTLSKEFASATWPARAANAVYIALPAGPDRLARAAIEQLNVKPGEPAADFIERAAAAAATVSTTTLKQRLRAVDRDDVIYGSVSLLLGVAASLVMTAAWYRAVRGG